MAAVDKRMAPARTTSLQRMLELEKKCKLERMQSTHTSPASSPPQPSETFHSLPSLQVRRADSFSQQEQNYLMLDAVRRSVTLPSLSITIPPKDAGRKREPSKERLREPQAEIVLDKEIAVEPFQKQVKFLAPDVDDMSDESSICQSPSWEGYGQRKKDKKKKAEQQKREKEQAEREARAAKRRLAARLSKSPPVNHRHTFNVMSVKHISRSMSDPLLNDFPGLAAQVIAQSNPGRLPSIPGTETPALLPESESSSLRFAGGTRLDEEQQFSTIQNPANSSSNTDSVNQRPRIQKAMSVGPVGLGLVGSTTTTITARSPRESCPPSASRTPLLRHSNVGHTRSHSLLQGATKIFKGRDARNHVNPLPDQNHSQESIRSISSGERGRSAGGYVEHHRGQSTERAMLGLADEQLLIAAAATAPAVRSISQQPTRARRPSLSSEAKAIAQRLTGSNNMPSPAPETRGHSRSVSHGDYFSFLEQPYSPPGAEVMSPVGSLPASMKTKTSPVEAPSQVPNSPTAVTSARDPLATIAAINLVDQASSDQASIVSRAQSNDGSFQKAKRRTLREAAMAALNIHKGPLSPTSDNTSKPPVSVPPYFHLRARLSSHSTNTAASKNPEPPQAPKPTEPPLIPVSPTGVIPKAARVMGEYNEVTMQSGMKGARTGNIKTTTIQTEPGSRVSEGSSSSSAYDDGSPLPSPVTTPDTSRPQSSKGLPSMSEGTSKPSSDHLEAQDDEITLRQPSDVDLPGTTRASQSSTPRIDAPASGETKGMSEEDRWSRTAMPLDMDLDAQSFVTSFSNLDNMDSLSEHLSSPNISPRPSAMNLRGIDLVMMDTKSPGSGSNEETDEAAVDQQPTQDHSRGPSLSRSYSNPDLQDDLHLQAMDTAFLIPPRSKKRDLVAKRPSTSPTTESFPESARDVKAEVARDMREWRKSRTIERRIKSPDRHMFPQGASGDEVISSEKQSEEKNSLATENTSDTENLKRAKAQKKEQTKPTEQREQEKGKGHQLEETHGADIEVHTLAVESPTPPLSRSVTSSSMASSSSSLFSSRFMSPIGGFVPSTGFTSNPSFVDMPETSKSSPAPSLIKSPSRVIEAPIPVHVGESISPPAMPLSRGKSATMPPRSMSTPASSYTQAVRPAKTAPVSILKQPTRELPAPEHTGQIGRPPVLSALPKHMQIQAGISVRPPALVAEPRVAPIAKMFVECCSCKFYHDMPSKLYECMARPDAVVEDRSLGISGAITTMVKCPWCQHNMSTNCCAGYAAVVYLKEKLH